MEGSAGRDRYQRQIALKELGVAGQQKLKQARVLVIGAGGLGCPALQYLSGAGIGTLGVADHDLLTLSNLHRQVLYSTSDIGLSKALRAGEILNELNPDIDIIVYNERLTAENSLQIISNFDIILDGTDNFASRYMINDACVLLDKILVYGAVSRYEGQVAVFNCLDKKGSVPANYRDLFPQPPEDGEILNCQEAGVLGVVPGIIGTMMATETIKLITGIGTPLINRFLTYDSLSNQMYEIELEARNGTRSLIPANTSLFTKTDYDWLCSRPSPFEILPEVFEKMLNDPDITIIDIREPGEVPVISDFAHRSIPLSQFMDLMPLIKNEKIILFCQSGKRSLSAAKMLSDHYGSSKKIYSLKGGIAHWKNETY